MSNRAFGVEIECVSPCGEYDVWDDTESCVEYSRDLLRKNNFPHWANLVTDDESIEGYGAEIKSPVLFGAKGFKELSKVMNLLRENNYFVTDDCGLHVHLDCPEWVENPKLIRKTVISWMKNQPLINNMVDSSRIDNEHCYSWCESDLKDLEEVLLGWKNFPNRIWEIGATHRGAINVGSLYTHGTIEIRQHEGTLDYEEAESWIKFCQAFIDSMTGKEVRKISTEELLLKRLKVEKNASRFISNKVRRNKQSRPQSRLA